MVANIKIIEKLLVVVVQDYKSQCYLELPKFC